MKNKHKVYHAEWKAVTDPLYYIICPHCKADILMSKTTVMERLIRWAKHLKK